MSTRNRFVLTATLASIAGLHCSLAAAGDWRISTEDNPAITVSASVWESTGDTRWDHDATSLDPTVGNPTSRLKYEGLDSTVFELRGRIELPQRFFAELAYGAGSIDEGTLVDEDFLSAFGSSAFGATVPGEHLFSQTVSDIDGDDLRYYDLILGRKVHKSDRGNVGVFVRYLDWQEQLEARGVRQTVCTAPNVLCSPAGFSGFGGRTVIFNDVTWQALFIGVDLARDLTDRVSVSGRLAYSPYAELTNEDRHLLRGDLRQDPSFEMEGTGDAYSADINANFYITPALVASIGFRYWKMQVEDENGGWTVFPVGGPPVTATLNNFESERKGVTLGLSYSWGGTPPLSQGP